MSGSTVSMYLVYIDAVPRSIISAESEELAMAGAIKAHEARGLITLQSAFTCPLDDLLRVVALGFIEMSSLVAAFIARQEATAAAEGLERRMRRPN